MRSTITLRALAFVLAVACLPVVARAEKVSSTKAISRTVRGSLSVKPVGDQIEMFSGMKSGDIEVTFIPKDATEATILFKNKTGRPVAIRVPEAFAGVPVLAQMGGMGMGGMGMGGMGGGGMGGMGGGGMQGMGGGMGGMMGGMGGGMMGGMGGMGMGGFGGMMMNVAPDKIVKIKVPLVCLEHGKKDPNPRAKYEIRPLESFTTNPEVAEVCKMLGRGEVDQNSAQAAAWHFTNGMTLEQLAHKERVHLSNGYSEKFFGEGNLVFAVKIVSEANKRAKELATTKKSKSLSQN